MNNEIRIKSVIDVSNETAEVLRIERTYSLPDGLVIEVVDSLTPPQPHTFVQQQFDRAIELLEACSEDLFITNTDEELENHIDTFLKEVKS